MTYKLQLSVVGELQAAKTYCYELEHCGDENKYCVSVSEWCNETKGQESKKFFVTDGVQANNVVQYLYQNAVAPVHLQDVLHDLKFQGHIAMRE